MKRMSKLVGLVWAAVILSGTVVWAGPRYETGEEELTAVVRVGQTAIINMTKCSNCTYFDGIIGIEVIQPRRIDGHTFEVKGLKTGEGVINLTDKAQPKMKARIKVKVVP